MASFLSEILKQGVAGQVLQQMAGGQQPAAQQTTTPNGAQAAGTTEAAVAQNDPNAALKQAAAGAGMGALGQMLQNGKLSSMATSAMGLVNSVKNLRR